MKHLDQLTDEELIQLFLKGNSNAMGTIVMRYKTRIYTSVFMLVKDSYLAEDIFQDAFITIIDAVKNGRYNEEKKFLSWAIKIAQNKCMDHFRKSKRNPVFNAAENFDNCNVAKCTQPGQDNIVEDDYKRIFALIDKLPEEQREIVVLRHYADLSFKDIARITNCSVNTALGRMRYALINLRKMMAERGVMVTL